MRDSYIYPDKHGTRLAIEETTLGDALLTLSRDGEHPASVSVIVPARDAVTVADEILKASGAPRYILLPRPDAEVADRVNTAFGVLKAEGGKVVHECGNCGEPSGDAVDPETARQIAAALALVSMHAEANPEPEFALALHFHAELCRGSHIGVRACGCLVYARLAIAALTENKDLIR
ncbi:hypothetical protein [Streptosporangium sp. NPDC002524]|uniref:hypothetical protein n=1 Tax=Streptosporangium sp. NPDC002524 TaxID=3154537 RepID=UPI00331C306E